MFLWACIAFHIFNHVPEFYKHKLYFISADPKPLILKLVPSIPYGRQL